MISFENLLILSVYFGSLFGIVFYGYYSNIFMYREKYIESEDVNEANETNEVNEANEANEAKEYSIPDGSEENPFPTGDSIKMNNGTTLHLE